MRSGLMGWLRSFLVPSTRPSKVPILGVEGAGKSSLLYTIATYVSLHRWGHVNDKDGALVAMQECVMRGSPIPPTLNHSAVEVVLRKVPDGCGGTIDTGLTISCRDVPGGSFRRLADELERDPRVGRRSLLSGQGLLGEFGQLLRGAAGLVIVLDIVRDMNPQEFQRYPDVAFQQGCGEQIRPVLRALRFAQDLDSDAFRDKMVLFVWTKRDLHQLSQSTCDKLFDRTFSIELRALEARGVMVRRYDVQAACWDHQSNLTELGIEQLLVDLAHGVGAAGAQGGGK